MRATISRSGVKSLTMRSLTSVGGTSNSSLAGTLVSLSNTTPRDGAVGRGISISPLGFCSGSSVDTRRMRNSLLRSVPGTASAPTLARRVLTGKGSSTGWW